jgi:hypothetical protein
MKKSFLSFAIAAMAALTLSASAHAEECYSTGVRTGTIQKFASKGILSKSYEGELVQDGLRTKQDAGVTNVWRFSAVNTQVADKIDAFALSGHPVTLKYCQSFFRNPMKTSTAYIVTEAVAVSR